VSEVSNPEVAARDAAASPLIEAEWRRYTEPLTALAGRLAGHLLHTEDGQIRHELYRTLFSQLSAAYFSQLQADPRYPDFWPMYSSAYNSQAPNPDNSHYLTPIDDDGVYRISGFRGTVKRVSFSIGTGTLYTRGTMEGGAIRSLGEYDLDDLTLGEDGAFEVLLSRERPPESGGNWWQLGAGATNILVRQTSYDWINEIDARIAIERLDGPTARPRRTEQELAAALQNMADYTEGSVRVTALYFSTIRQKFGFNRLGYIDNTEWAPVVTQRYAYGAFKLREDEALLIECQLPARCRYWSIHLTEDLGATLDYINRQTSLNGFTAHAGEDRIFRVVISAQDPGVPNWLDTTGLSTGVIQSRWEGCDAWPEFSTRLIKLADVRAEVPPDTPLIDAEQRESAIRRRRKGAQMRKRW